MAKRNTKPQYVDDVVDKIAKKVMKRQIVDAVEQEAKDEIFCEASSLVRKWSRENREKIQQMVAKELEKVLPSLISQFVKKAGVFVE
jgi:chemotaxis regulatin CheY-phosphate phosphatase CheZ